MPCPPTGVPVHPLLAQARRTARRRWVEPRWSSLPAAVTTILHFQIRRWPVRISSLRCIAAYAACTGHPLAHAPTSRRAWPQQGPTRGATHCGAPQRSDRAPRRRRRHHGAPRHQRSSAARRPQGCLAVALRRIDSTSSAAVNARRRGACPDAGACVPDVDARHRRPAAAGARAPAPRRRATAAQRERVCALEEGVWVAPLVRRRVGHPC